MSNQVRTPEDRKKEARKLIRLPESKRPAHVHFTPAKRLSFASWMVELDGLEVHFQDDGNRIWYLGEYTPEQTSRAF